MSSDCCQPNQGDTLQIITSQQTDEALNRILALFNDSLKRYLMEQRAAGATDSQIVDSLVAPNVLDQDERLAGIKAWADAGCPVTVTAIMQDGVYRKVHYPSAADA
jgi:hypothetical protein